MLKLLGFGCYGFALVDFAGMFFGYDLTGVSWSPIVASVLGGVLASIGRDDEQGVADSLKGGASEAARLVVGEILGNED